MSSHLLHMMSGVPDAATYFLKVLEVSCHKFKLAPSRNAKSESEEERRCLPPECCLLGRNRSHPGLGAGHLLIVLCRARVPLLLTHLRSPGLSVGIKSLLAAALHPPELFSRERSLWNAQNPAQG